MTNYKETNHSKGEEPELRGTFTSVMILGACIVVSWFAAFILFITR